MFDVLIWALLGVAGLFSAGHALLHKRDSRAALGWIVTCVALPGVGPCLYWLFGVNRIRTRARIWQARGQGIPWCEPAICTWSLELERELPFRQGNFPALLTVADTVTRRPLLGGNALTPLHNGEEAYPAMLAAIAGAGHSVYLSTYIFDADTSGRRFVVALEAAAARGVDVRVLIDGVGERYSFPTARHLLRHGAVRVACFLPPRIWGRGIFFNLRNHRKLLVVDGTIGFTGGMNLGDRHLAAAVDNPHRVVDMHFRLEGPSVTHLQEAFFEDWSFVTGEAPPAPNLAVTSRGSVFCRGISAGPNEEFEQLHWILIGALNAARQRVRIMTPYFIPDRALISALNAAALRGVQVEIILPEKNNLAYVAWAMQAYYWELLQYGIALYHRPGPFAHTKMLLVDDIYAQIGSANLDPRSLRLNFEFNLEVYDGALCGQLATHFEEVRAGSRQLTLPELDARPLPRRLRDAFAKLFSPYL